MLWLSHSCVSQRQNESPSAAPSLRLVVEHLVVESSLGDALASQSLNPEVFFTMTTSARTWHHSMWWLVPLGIALLVVGSLAWACAQSHLQYNNGDLRSTSFAYCGIAAAVVRVSAKSNGVTTGCCGPRGCMCVCVCAGTCHLPYVFDACVGGARHLNGGGPEPVSQPAAPGSGQQRPQALQRRRCCQAAHTGPRVQRHDNLAVQSFPFLASVSCSCCAFGCNACTRAQLTMINGWLCPAPTVY